MRFSRSLSALLLFFAFTLVGCDTVGTVEVASSEPDVALDETKGYAVSNVTTHVRDDMLILSWENPVTADSLQQVTVYRRPLSDDCNQSKILDDGASQDENCPSFTKVAALTNGETSLLEGSLDPGSYQYMIKTVFEKAFLNRAVYVGVTF